MCTMSLVISTEEVDVRWLLQCKIQAMPLHWHRNYINWWGGGKNWSFNTTASALSQITIGDPVKNCHLLSLIGSTDEKSAPLVPERMIRCVSQSTTTSCTSHYSPHDSLVRLVHFRSLQSVAGIAVCMKCTTKNHKCVRDCWVETALCLGMESWVFTVSTWNC